MVESKTSSCHTPIYTQSVIFHGNHFVTKLIVCTEHLHFLHAGPTLLTFSLCCLHIIGCRKIVHSITRGCTVCHHNTAKPKSQMLGQLSVECTTPESMFERVSVDYAGPFYITYGFVRKPTIVQSLCMQFCLSSSSPRASVWSYLSGLHFLFETFCCSPWLSLLYLVLYFIGANWELREFSSF